MLIFGEVSKFFEKNIFSNSLWMQMLLILVTMFYNNSHCKWL